MERNRIVHKSNHITDINILLLSGTGNEKVFFVNTLVNCLAYRDPEEAKQKRPLVYMVPCDLLITDKHRQFHTISIKSNADNYHQVDSLGLLDVKTLVVPDENRRISLKIVYSEGLGDPRGHDQDNINFEKILYYIGNLEMLHAIFFVFNPNDIRIPYFYKYWIKLLYSSLESSVAENFVFIYTYNEISEHGISKADTLLNLKRMLAENSPYVNIEGEKNVFAFDEDAFRYMAGYAYEVEIDESKYLRHFKSSFSETNRLMKYLAGGEKNMPVRPCFLKDPKFINEARRKINVMGQPIIDTLQLIIDNLRLLVSRQQELDRHDRSGDNYSFKFYLTTLKLRVKELGKPVTVCSHVKCLDCLLIHGTKIWSLRQKCHELCYLRSNAQEFVGGSELKFCKCMSEATETCAVCNCPKSVHMHVYYLTEKFQESIIPEDATKERNEVGNPEDFFEYFKTVMKERDESLKQDKKTLLKCIAKFVCFLEKHSITPFNNIYTNYMKLMISRESQLGRKADPFIIQEWKNILSEYTAIYDNQMVNLLFDTDRPFYADGMFVENELRKLSRMNNFGNDLIKMYLCQTVPRMNEFQATYSAHAFFDLKRVNTDIQIMTNREKNDDNKENFESLDQAEQIGSYISPSKYTQRNPSENAADVVSDIQNKLEATTLSQLNISTDSYSEYNNATSSDIYSQQYGDRDPRNRSSYDKPSVPDRISRISAHTTSKHDNQSMSNSLAIRETSFRNDRLLTENHRSNVNQYNYHQANAHSLPNWSLHPEYSTNENKSNVNRNSGNVYSPPFINYHVQKTPSKSAQVPLNQRENITNAVNIQSNNTQVQLYQEESVGGNTQQIFSYDDTRTGKPQEPYMPTNNLLPEATVDRNNYRPSNFSYKIPPSPHPSKIDGGHRRPNMEQLVFHQSKPVGENTQPSSSNTPEVYMPILGNDTWPYMAPVTQYPLEQPGPPPYGQPMMVGGHHRLPFMAQVTQYPLVHPGPPPYSQPMMVGGHHRLPYMGQGSHYQPKPAGGNIQQNSSNAPQYVEPYNQPILAGGNHRLPNVEQGPHCHPIPDGRNVQQRSSNSPQNVEPFG
ncbi:hypothetical protein WA026_008483 [Henosepilachna vigintioctopunctata]|uniref:DUF8206 domain-containing protein n=1 Tax=Henosepilachna vigintioctopunctata TaxID=420089 RepID=A0AAW1U8B0_9CUCU